MFKRILIVLFASLFLLSNRVISQPLSDSIKSYTLPEVEVTGRKLLIGSSALIGKDNLDNIFNKAGIELIRKGVFFAQDLYSEGFKKGEIAVNIDGEQTHCACPNRMDAPITRINPLEIFSVYTNKSSGEPGSKLGGSVNFYRAIPADNLKISAFFSQLAGAQNISDAALSFEKSNQRISLHYIRGGEYKNGEGEGFTKLYGYKEDKPFQLAELSYFGNLDNFTYGASVLYSENIAFPYLQMDEINNRVYSAHFSFKGNKIYFSYTDHLMNNDLRTQNMMPVKMETHAKNLTIGFTGSFYDFYFRNWNAENYLMQNSGAGMRIDNNMLPEIKFFSFAMFDKFKLNDFSFAVRGGAVLSSSDESLVTPLRNNIYPGASDSRFFPVFGINALFSPVISEDINFGAAVELLLEHPEAEALYIAVRRMPGRPLWSGNPDLSQPFKAGLRFSGVTENLRVELFGSRVWNFVNQVKKTSNNANYLTYENNDVFMTGVNAGVEFPYFESNLTYTYAQNLTNDEPLSETPPLRVVTKIYTPEIGNFRMYLRHTYSDAQLRIDFSLNETTTPAYNKIDLGIDGTLDNFILSIAAENVLNANYYSHLSYLRDPFASGMRVYDPGLTLRFNVKYIFSK